jgi:L-serine deaminase
MLDYCKETGLSLSGMVMQNELALHSKKEIEEYFANVWQTMRACIQHHAAVLQHVAAVGELQRLVGVLLDEEDGHPLDRDAHRLCYRHFLLSADGMAV